MAEFDPNNHHEIEEYVAQAVQHSKEGHGNRAWELAKKASPPLRIGSFLVRNSGLLLGMLVGGGAALATVADMVRIPPEKRVEASGGVQAVWSTTEVDILHIDGFAYSIAEEDTVAFDPSAVIQGMPHIVMKYAPEKGRYISYEVVKHPVIGDYIRIAEYDEAGNSHDLNYGDPIFHTLLAEECSLEVLDGKMEPDSACTDPDDPAYRGIIDHAQVYTGYPLLDDLSIVADAEVGYIG